MTKSSTTRRFASAHPRAAGFSLVETALALGILSFAFIPLLAIIPAALTTFATAISTTVEAQVVQRVTTLARQTKFSELSKLDSHPGKQNGEETPDFYFNEQGTEVVDAEAIAQFRYVYTAAIVLQPESGLPSKTGAQAINSNLVTLNIITKRISAPKERRTASIWIANNGS